MAQPDAETASPTLAEKLNTLFATVRDDRGRPYSNQRVADAVGVSDAYVGYLRRGLRTNPSRATLEALAAFFEVTPEFFFDSATAAQVSAQIRRLHTLSRLRDAGVLKVAMRLGGLSDHSLETVAAMVEQLRRLEQLPEPEGIDEDEHR